MKQEVVNFLDRTSGSLNFMFKLRHKQEEEMSHIKSWGGGER